MLEQINPESEQDDQLQGRRRVRQDRCAGRDQRIRHQRVQYIEG